MSGMFPIGGSKRRMGMINLFVAILAFFATHRYYDWIVEEKELSHRIVDLILAIIFMLICVKNIDFHLRGLQ